MKFSADKCEVTHTGEKSKCYKRGFKLGYQY